MKINMKSLLGVGIVVLMLLVGGVWFFFRQEAQQSVDELNSQVPASLVEGQEHIVTLTEDGYIPEEITIKKGDTVTWKSDTGGLFWPASNLHPSHRDYPGGVFDPKQPIEPESSWNFTFGEVGDWKYHDHLAPYYTGVVHVNE